MLLEPVAENEAEGLVEDGEVQSVGDGDLGGQLLLVLDGQVGHQHHSLEDEGVLLAFDHLGLAAAAGGKQQKKTIKDGHEDANAGGEVGQNQDPDKGVLKLFGRRGHKDVGTDDHEGEKRQDGNVQIVQTLGGPGVLAADRDQGKEQQESEDHKLYGGVGRDGGDDGNKEVAEEHNDAVVVAIGAETAVQERTGAVPPEAGGVGGGDGPLGERDDEPGAIAEET